MEKLKNVLKFKDFEKNWKAEKATKTKRTDTGHDILKEEYVDKGDDLYVYEPDDSKTKGEKFSNIEETLISKDQLSKAEEAIITLAEVLGFDEQTMIQVIEDGINLDDEEQDPEDLKRYEYFLDEMRATFGYEGEDLDRPSSDFHSTIKYPPTKTNLE